MTAQTAATIAQDLVEEFDEEQPATVVSLAAETLGRDLLQALLQEVRVLPDVWPKLTEKKQADVIDRLRSTVERTVKYAVKLISAGERPAIGGILESVAIKEGIKATFKVSQFDPLRHDLIDRAGKVCMLVVADAEEYLQGMDTVAPDPDQSALALDESDDGADAGDVAPTLRSGNFRSHSNPATQADSLVIASAVRRLTPRECERLQGFPDDYTLVPDWDGWRPMDASETPESCQAEGLAVRQAKRSKRWYVRDVDGPRYKAIGNSKAVPVVRWIGRRIKQQLERTA